MKIYNLIRRVINCDDTYRYDTSIGLYVNKENALKTKEVWEFKWQEHTKNHIDNYPCWFDSEPTLKIEEIDTDDDLLIIKKLNADN